MKISKLIKILFAMMKHHGDIEVYLKNDTGIGPAENISVEKVVKKKNAYGGEYEQTSEKEGKDTLFID